MGIVRSTSEGQTAPPPAAPTITELYEGEYEALYQFSKAFLEQKRYTLEGGFDPYPSDWLRFYEAAKRRRQEAERAAKKAS